MQSKQRRVNEQRDDFEARRAVRREVFRPLIPVICLVVGMALARLAIWLAA